MTRSFVISRSAECTLLVRQFTPLRRVQELYLILVPLTRGNIAVLNLYELRSPHMYYGSMIDGRDLSLMHWGTELIKP